MTVPGHCLSFASYVNCIFVISVIDSFGFKSKYFGSDCATVFHFYNSLYLCFLCVFTLLVTGQHDGFIQFLYHFIYIELEYCI